MGHSHVIGLKEELKRLQQAPERLRKKVLEVLEERAEAVRVDAASRAPVRTGALRRSIKKQVSEKTLAAKVYADYPEPGGNSRKGHQKGRKYYAFAVEFGTKRMAAKPFLYPAARAAEARTKAALEEVLKEVAGDE